MDTLAGIRPVSRQGDRQVFRQGIRQVFREETLTDILEDGPTNERKNDASTQKFIESRS